MPRRPDARRVAAVAVVFDSRVARQSIVPSVRPARFAAGSRGCDSLRAAAWRSAMHRLSACLLPARSAAAEASTSNVTSPPLLVRHCAGCHNASDPAGGLNLTAARHGAGAAAKAACRRSFRASRTRAICSSGFAPAKCRPRARARRVAAAELARLEAWIAAGAAWPEDRVLSPFEFTTRPRAGRDWWSLATAAPARDPAGRSTPIACARRSTPSCSPSSKRTGSSSRREADRATLIRRASLDLLGLPPTPEEIDAFRRRHVARRLRATGRSPAGLAPLRRALGAALARRGALRRKQRLRNQHGPAERLAVSRLGDRGAQRRHALSRSSFSSNWPATRWAPTPPPAFWSAARTTSWAAPTSS